MKKSKLLDVFLSISNKEIKEISLFIRSPFYNRRQTVVDLFDFLVENKDLPEGALSKEKAWKYVFPNQEYEDSKMRYTMSFLLQVLKEYLINQEFKKDKTYSHILLCRALRHRGIDNLFEKEMGATIDWQEKQSFRDAHFHYNNYLLGIERETYLAQKTRAIDPELQTSVDELTSFYISDMLRQSCGALSLQSLMQRDYTLNFLKEVLEHVEHNDYSDKPAIGVYFNGYKALKDLDDEESFKQLKLLIERHWPDFPMEESRNIYVLAINCCIKRLNRGNRAYIREGFELYKSGLENKVLLENGVLSKYTYDNAARLGLALKEFDWVEFFLKSYKSYLPASDRENIFTYSLAVFYFQKPDYENAMELLLKVDFKDVLNNLDARRMLLRMYYELGEYNALESLLESFKVYLNRQKNIGYHKDHYVNLIYFINKMLRTNLDDRGQKNKLIKEIESRSSVAEKSWLLEQLR